MQLRTLEIQREFDTIEGIMHIRGGSSSIYVILANVASAIRDKLINMAFMQFLWCNIAPPAFTILKDEEVSSNQAVGVINDDILEDFT